MSETAATLDEIRARADSVRTGGVAEGFPAIHKVGRQKPFGANGRVAILAGARTPFAKAGTDLKELDVIDLAGIAGAEAVARSGPRAYRDLLVECGAIGERIYLAAESVQLGARNLAAFHDDELGELLGFGAEGRAVLHLTLLGREGR